MDDHTTWERRRPRARARAFGDFTTDARVFYQETTAVVPMMVARSIPRIAIDAFRGRRSARADSLSHSLNDGRRPRPPSSSLVDVDDARPRDLTRARSLGSGVGTIGESFTQSESHASPDVLTRDRAILDVDRSKRPTSIETPDVDRCPQSNFPFSLSIARSIDRSIARSIDRRRESIRTPIDDRRRFRRRVARARVAHDVHRARRVYHHSVAVVARART